MIIILNHLESQLLFLPEFQFFNYYTLSYYSSLLYSYNSENRLKVCFYCGSQFVSSDNICHSCIKSLEHKSNYTLLDNRNTSHRSLPGKVLSYDKKLYVTGDLAEEYQFNFKIRKNIKSRINRNVEKRKSKFLDPKIAKISLSRSKRKFRRLVNTNINRCKRSKFISLTFNRDVSVSEASRCFDIFMKRMKRRFKFLSYIWVKERTKKGRIHFHCIFLTNYFIPVEILRDCWGQGFVWINLIKDKRNVGSYMSKYMSKDVSKGLVIKEKNERFYSFSLHLDKPIELYSNFDNDFFPVGYSLCNSFVYEINETLTVICRYYNRKC